MNSITRQPADYIHYPTYNMCAGGSGRYIARLGDGAHTILRTMLQRKPRGVGLAISMYVQYKRDVCCVCKERQLHTTLPQLTSNGTATMQHSWPSLPPIYTPHMHCLFPGHTHKHHWVLHKVHSTTCTHVSTWSATLRMYCPAFERLSVCSTPVSTTCTHVDYSAASTPVHRDEWRS